MASCSFTPSSREDLIDIWLYTQATWGEAQADRYNSELEECCQRIVAGAAHVRRVPDTDIWQHHCRHHYIFFLRREAEIVVIAVLHESMDFIRRLSARL
ncbi:MAG: type II toxin-antitoxin system RelE/ParE family toxin [Alphaproteobacteria bacterium]|nr:type II toxin-antitoxin system RelE/ParE family toxin [Alphaproteobacteria bacterium]